MANLTCRYGAKCDKGNNCWFKHPNVNSVPADSPEDIKLRNKAMKLTDKAKRLMAITPCPRNPNCKTPDCKFKHQ